MHTYRIRTLFIILLAVAVGGLALAPYPRNTTPVDALDNGLALTPPMGWNPWNRFGCDINAQLVRETADALVASGMRDAGYRYVVIDDCWQIARDGNGNLYADPHRFPGGIQPLAEYVHARGLKLGIYTDAGHLTCARRPGSLGYEYQDAAAFAAWGVDYVKIDWCYTQGLDARTQYAKWRDAIARTGRPMVLSICEWGTNAPWEWGAEVGHLWRTTGDIAPRWSSVTRIIDRNNRHAAVAGPGRWNDPDMLQVGNRGMTYEEQRTHFSMWAIMAAPLIAGNDIRAMSPETLSILLNTEVIAVDQDPLGIQGTPIWDSGRGQQVWLKPLADGSRAVVLFNSAGTAADISVTWEMIGLPAGAAHVRDLWAHADRGAIEGGYTATVAPHGVVMLRIHPVAPPPPPPAGTVVHLSDLAPFLADNGFGPVERDSSNGEAAAGDGRPITLNGISYAKGLGVHAPSDIRYDLGGACSVFAADVGVDDEAGTYGAISFEVWGDGVLLFNSGPLTGDAPPLPVHLGIAGVRELRLVVTDGGDWTDYDHADWADARVVCP